MGYPAAAGYTPRAVPDLINYYHAAALALWLMSRPVCVANDASLMVAPRRIWSIGVQSQYCSISAGVSVILVCLLVAGFCWHFGIGMYILAGRGGGKSLILFVFVFLGGKTVGFKSALRSALTPLLPELRLFLCFWTLNILFLILFRGIDSRRVTDAPLCGSVTGTIFFGFVVVATT